MIAIIVLHSGPTAVSALAAAGLAMGALVAVPLGPWIEPRRKRPVTPLLLPRPEQVRRWQHAALAESP